LCLLRLLEFHGIIMVVALIPAAILIGARSEIRNKSELKEYWPLAALATGICSIVLVALLLYPLGSLSFFNDMPGLTSQGNFSKTLFGDGLPQSKNVRPLQNSGTSERAKKQNQKEEDLAEKHKDLRLSQLCIVGSTCFWATALIVLMWSIRLTHERVEHVGVKIALLNNGSRHRPEKNRQDIGINLSMK